MISRVFVILMISRDSVISENLDTAMNLDRAEKCITQLSELRKLTPGRKMHHYKFVEYELS